MVTAVNQLFGVSLCSAVLWLSMTSDIYVQVVWVGVCVYVCSRISVIIQSLSLDFPLLDFQAVTNVKDVPERDHPDSVF